MEIFPAVSFCMVDFFSDWRKSKNNPNKYTYRENRVSPDGVKRSARRKVDSSPNGVQSKA